ncbi:bifunctional 3-deoxy-7-phosphoheptulonate synthase/chorismate mutase type II [Fibrella sp. HMF5335]|uniref:chorismate mutase n=1 Tax=Fibrella rubiginis TaxID=2817060 RepID=A0A939K8P9_9BACT|nr:chorismate mutase [Fibrella rubiginis]MBO0939970.1 bifunctional 3-deoxy-7-phosphoheptulonate synthase/chorismate mutase type II [Fibrella rubiginis]
MKPDLAVAPLNSWIQTNGKPLIIAGPCSAETEEQLCETARQLAALGSVHAIRAGIWKPRTRPGSFEGMGEAALPWIQRAKAETGLPFAVEVATPQHIELALKYGVDILWVGARTTVNPFNVQEIADALKGVDVPVLIKNPVNPDLALWVGAFERIAGAGITKLGAIHRGFSTGEASKYRNIPMWQMAIELRTMFPQLPIIGDPSHMAGKRAYLNELAQMAMDLNYDGLIVESHIDPDKAWSDAAQQLTPAAFGEMLDHLQIRQLESPDREFQGAMEQIRVKIDSVDRQLVEMLAARMSLVEKMAEYKRDNNVSMFQPDRWKEILETRKQLGLKLNLYPELVEEIYKIIHMESIRKQTEVMNSAPVV